MQLSAKRRAMVSKEWSEDFSGDGYWIMLKTGWQWDGCHVVHEPTKAKAYKAMVEVEPCDCPDCK